VEDYCTKNNIPLLLNIPLDRRIAGLYSRGELLIEGMPEWRQPFRDLFENVKEKAHAS
jgi:MinD superfamily P-loop ATPase